jgi:ATP-dependent exoDNAse (exonuclease V) alpha subunit
VEIEQLEPVNDRCNFDYKNSLALFEIVDSNRLTLTKCRRANDELFEMLKPGNIEKLTKDDFEHVNYDRNLSFTNKKRMAINKMEMDKMIKQKKVKALELKALDYDPNSQDVRLCTGMPVIARKNSKLLHIFNNETFTIKAIKRTENEITVEDEGKEHTVPISEFTKIFNVAYCITVHKSQGATFDEPYTIHEFNQFDER